MTSGLDNYLKALEETRKLLDPLKGLVLIMLHPKLMK